MISDVQVRALIPPDWEIFRDIRLRALQAHPGVYLSSYEKEVDEPEEYWSGALDGQGKMVCCLFDGDKPAGLAGVFTWRGDPDGESGVMAMDYVDAPYRGQGLSRLLYRARIDWALGQPQLKRLVISHREGNEASRRANQAFGFAFTGKEMTLWPDGVEALEYNYVLDLQSLRRT